MTGATQNRPLCAYRSAAQLTVEGRSGFSPDTWSRVTRTAPAAMACAATSMSIADRVTSSCFPAWLHSDELPGQGSSPNPLAAPQNAISRMSVRNLPRPQHTYAPPLPKPSLPPGTLKLEQLMHLPTQLEASRPTGARAWGSVTAEGKVRESHTALQQRQHKNYQTNLRFTPVTRPVPAFQDAPLQRVGNPEFRVGESDTEFRRAPRALVSSIT